MIKLFAIANAAICIGFLINGFRTGHMKLFGAAKRRENPVWFWSYAAFNALGVVVGVVIGFWR